MDPAVWGFLGTAAGALAALGGTLLVHRGERRERAAREQRRARDERKDAYIRLLSTARQLRYLARPGSTVNRGESGALRFRLSNTHYEIELIAPKELVGPSDAVRRQVLDYINLAERLASDARSPTVPESDALESERQRARAAVEDFTRRAREDLGIGEEAALARRSG